LKMPPIHYPTMKKARSEAKYMSARSGKMHRAIKTTYLDTDTWKNVTVYMIQMVTPVTQSDEHGRPVKRSTKVRRV